MKFPNTEGEIGKLAQYMISGFRSQQETFPAPPVPPDELQIRFATYLTAREAAAAASGFAASAYTLKDEALEESVSDMKPTTSPKITRSAHSAMDTLGLDRLDIIHAGKHTFALDDPARAVTFKKLFDDVERL